MTKTLRVAEALGGEAPPKVGPQKAARSKTPKAPPAEPVVIGAASAAAPARLVNGFEKGSSILKGAPAEPQSAPSAAPVECHKCGCRHLDFISARRFADLLVRDLECRNCGARVLDRVEMSKADEDSRGIVCGFCGGNSWKVRNTEGIPGAIRRYRICLACGRARATLEK